MGQYYHVITEDKDGTRTVYDIQTKKFIETQDYHEYNGLKIMEHSWIKNDFCTALALSLVGTPKRVAWVGDYTEDSELEEYGFTYEEVWGKEREEYTHTELTSYEVGQERYLCNISKNVYVDLKDYKKKSTVNGWCIFPISLLTAIGNGRGGGDYHSGTCLEDVGSWAFDEIYISAEKPKGYEKLDLYFIED